MIQPISDTTQITPTAPAQKDASSTLVHTPFGDVLVDEMATPNLAGLFGGQPSPAAATAPASKAPEAAAVSDTANPASPVVASATPVAPANPLAGKNTAGGPTAESLFGPDVFDTNPTGHGPNNTAWGYNPAYFATRHTADVLAKMLGGTVVERNAICPNGPMVQDQVNCMIDLPNGREVNAGLVADIFNHGRSQQVVDEFLQSEIAGAPQIGGAA